jgi:chromosomal replication initiation ATPase DnaA
VPVDPRLRFENFVVGSSNRLAASAAHAVASAPGVVYNPLFIYGGSGLGKTHLMCAIGNNVLKRTPDAVVEHVTLDDLVASLHAAVAGGTLEAARGRLHAATVLLVDDLQFLTGHRETQSELLRLFNSLQAAGRQLVLTSDRPPSELADVDERLLTRFSGGLIVDVGRPDYETRTAILRGACEARGVRFGPGVIEELARLELGNVRELQGALNRLIAAATLDGASIGPADVRPLLGELAEARVLATPAADTVGFDSFLQGVASTVAEQLDRWRPPLPGPSATFTRAGFEVGASNQLAVRAADTIVERPGERYNPLFIHGPSGAGKTHLLHAIGHGLAAARGPDRPAPRVAVLPAQAFVDELITALQDGALERWRAGYRDADALILDDVQFLAGRERTQEELFHAFNALHAAGRQLVFASDRPPRAHEGLEERLRSRFEGGLVVEMLPPDPALTAKLFARFLRAAGADPDPELVSYLAERAPANAREVVGLVNRILAAADAALVPVSLAVARSVLEPGAAAPPGRRPTPIPATEVADPFFLDEERVVWRWADLTGRLIEDVR